MRVLLTGGAGYIGSHIAVVLADRGHDAVALDNLSNSSAEAIRRVEKITGRSVPLIIGDATDSVVVATALADHQPDAVIHLAGLKSVSESVADPLSYYETNIGSAVVVLREMARAGVRKFVFSSSATVYEQPGALLSEDAAVGLKLANPYGRTKAIIEAIIGDASVAQPDLSAAILRYFNPVGVHNSGLIGESPRDIPNNLMPYVARVAVGKSESVRIFGDDYPTPDGTGVRDYIHVLDLAEGHVAALERVEPGVLTVNLGTGAGSSVRDVVAAFGRAVGHELPAEVVERRPGDVAVATADPRRADELLGWAASRSLEQSCADAWRWQQANPDGYVD